MEEENMSRKRKKGLIQRTINIKAKTNLPTFIDWLHRRLFLLKTKFCFQVTEKSYILLSNFSPTDTGVTISAMLNGKEPLGSIRITTISENLKEGIISVQYDYPNNLSQIASNLILDLGVHFDSLESLPQAELESLQEPESLPEETISIMEFDFYLENVDIDQFTDWVISEY
jgi:hypothetical protein